jgi:FkbM family methyltransferase
VNEFIAFLEVFVLRDYDIPGFDWHSARTIVDVGANIGIATVWFAERAQQARILAVEPSPVALAVLETNLVANRLDDRVSVVPLALGGMRGMGYLRPAATTVETRVAGASAPHATNDQLVSITTLEQLMSDWQLPSVDILKLDCEGAEYEALLSADATVLNRISNIVGEYHAVENFEPGDLERHLQSCGFEVQMRRHPRDPNLGRFIARLST